MFSKNYGNKKCQVLLVINELRKMKMTMFVFCYCCQ